MMLSVIRRWEAFVLPLVTARERGGAFVQPSDGLASPLKMIWRGKEHTWWHRLSVSGGMMV